MFMIPRVSGNVKDSSEAANLFKLKTKEIEHYVSKLDLSNIPNLEHRTIGKMRLPKTIEIGFINFWNYGSHRKKDHNKYGDVWAKYATILFKNTLDVLIDCPASDWPNNIPFSSC